VDNQNQLYLGTKKGVELEEGFKYHLLEDEDQSTLVVVEADACDAGEYTCVAVNEVGTFSSKATLQVADKESSLTEATSPEVMPLVIAEPLKDFITREGQSARFTCKITGTNPTVVWTRNGQRIQPTPYFKISEYNGVQQLDISETYPEDKGKYCITASNQTGTVSSTAHLKLDIEAPTVVEPLQPVHVVEGSTVQLMCTIKGDDLAIRWYEKGQPITTESNRWRHWIEDNGQCYLVISNCCAADSGEIRCHASNLAGEAVCSTDILVTEKSSLPEKKIRQIEQLEKQLTTTIDEYEIKLPTDAATTEYSPVIIEPLASKYSVSENTLQHFQVSVVAQPQPTVAWYKDGVEVDVSEMKARFYSETDPCSNVCTYGFLLSPTEWFDSGDYEFRAVNNLGSASCSTSLSVRGKQIDNILRVNDILSLHDPLPLNAY